jgi:hypothetical protein
MPFTASVIPMPQASTLGGVNHCICSLHCRLAKIRGVMVRVTYRAVIGRKTRFFVCVQ